MDLFLEHRLIFIHNPKAAGTSIIRALGGRQFPPSSFAHLSCNFVKNRFFAKSWNSFISLSIVREPVSRYKSLYMYQRSIEYGILQADSFSHRIARQYSFNEWIEFNLLSKSKSNWFAVPQSEWWNDVEQVFRFEEIEKVFTYLDDITGIRLERLHVNQCLYTEDVSCDSQLAAKILELDYKTAVKFY